MATQDMPTPPLGGEHRPTGRLKADSVGLLGTIGIAVGPQAPTGGIALLPAVMAGIVGAAASLSFLLGLIAMVFVAYAFVIFSRRIASAGMLYTYTGVAVGSTFGAVVGFAWMVLFLAVAGWLCVQDGNYLVAVFQPSGLHLPWLPMSIVMWAIMIAISYRSIHLSAFTVIVVEAIGVVMMLVIAIAVVVHGGFHGHGLSLHPFSTSGHSFSVVMSGVVFAFTSFAGFEAAGGLGEESTNPRRTIPVAIFSALIISGLLYVVMTWVLTVGFGSGKALAASSTPLATIAKQYIGGGMGTITNIAALASGFGAQVACLVAGTRMMFALSRDGLDGRPREALIRTHPKFGTPIVPLVISSAAALVAFLLFAGAGPRGDITDVSSYGADIQVIVYLLVVIAAVVFCWRWERKPIHFVVLIIGVIVMGYVVKDSVYPVPAYPLNWAMYGALFTFVVGAALMAGFPVLRRRFASATGPGRERVIAQLDRESRVGR